VRAPLLRLLRVPPNPDPPPGAPPKIFRAADNYFVLLVLRTIAMQFVGLLLPLGLTIPLLAINEGRVPDGFAGVAALILTLVWGFYIAQMILNLAMMRLDFELRWYMLSDRAIRVREGILTIREKTIALANIQNLEVRQGPLQRMLGIADLEVKTAGGGAEAGRGKNQQSPMVEQLHVAYFRGVADANAIRDLIRDGIRKQRDSGLGDPDDHKSENVSATLHSQVAELRHEAAQLRALIATGNRTPLD